jgi:hypothetical protein
MLSKTGDWTNPEAEVKVTRDINGEPQLQDALQALGLGTLEQATQHQKLVDAWSLKPITGTLNEYTMGPKLYNEMKGRWPLTGHLYSSIHARYNATSGRLEINPRTQILGSESNLESTETINITKTDRKTYEGDITQLAENQVFVFGANDQGRHGAGAAGVAMGQNRTLKELKQLTAGTKGKWAVIGEHSRISTGTEGKSYGLVTVKGEIGGKDVNNRISEAELLGEIERFYNTAVQHPELEFLVAYSGKDSNKKLLSGYTSKELANLFGSIPIPENVKFEKALFTLMANSPRRFITDELVLQDQSTRKPLQINEEILEASRKKLSIQIYDQEGKGTGNYFSADQAMQATNSIIYNVQMILARTGTVSAAQIGDEIKQKFNTFYKIFALKSKGIAEIDDPFPQFSQEQSTAIMVNLTNVINSFDALFIDSLSRMKVYGITIKNLDSVGTDYGDIDLQEGKGLENFGDVHFTLDPRDTASARLKLFIATVEESREGIVPRPKIIRIPLSPAVMQQVLDGTRTSTIRTAEQLKDMRLDNTPAKSKGSVKLGDKWFVVQVVKPLSAAEADAYNKSENAEEGYIANAGDFQVNITPYIEEKGTVPVPSFIGMPQIANFESLFEDVTGVLADRKPSFKDYVAALRSSPKPNLRRLADKLEYTSTSERLRKEFVTVMSKSYTQFTLVRYSGNVEKGMSIENFDANRYAAKKVILKNWQELQKLAPIMVRDTAGNLAMDPAIVQELRGAFTEVQARFAQKEDAANIAITYNKATALVQRMFEVNGMIFTNAMYEDLFKNLEWYTSNNPLASKSLKEGFKMNQDGSPGGVFAAFVNSITKEKADSEDLDNSIQRNNPMYNESNAMNILARWYSKHTDTLYNSTHRDMAGNNIWDYTLNTYLSKTYGELTSENPRYRDELRSTFYAKNSWLLDAWDDNVASRRSSEILYLEGLKKKYGKKGAERDEMSDRDQLFMSLGLFMNQGRKYAHFLSMTHSDKTRSFVTTNIPRTTVMAAGKDVHSELLGRLYSVFTSEFDRISGTAGKVYEQQQYEKGKKYFFMMPFFNHKNMLVLKDGGHITEKELAQIWISDTELNTPARDLPQTKEVVLKLLKLFVNIETNRQLEEFEDTGIVSAKEGVHMFDKRYIKNSRRVENQVGLVQNGDYYMDKTSGAQVTISKEEYYRRLSRFVAMDYAMNTFLYNTAVVQLVYGDPAEVFKGDVDSTFLEYQKRLAGHIAPGKETEWESPSYHTVTMEDMRMGLDYIKNIPQYHTGVNVTDAQEFVTMEEHLNVMRQYGQLDEVLYKEMMAIIKPGEYYKFKKKEHLDIVLQITKPVYFGKRSVQDGALLHDYVKSSALALYPPYTADLEIDGLRRDMERGIMKDGQLQTIQRAHFISAKKIGYPKPGETFKNGIYSGIDTEAVQVLSRDGFRIQQEVPHDPNKNEIQIASQANKLISADMPQSIELTMRSGITLKGPQAIREYKEQIRIKLLQENIKEFTEEMDVEHVDGDYRFKDPTKLINRLVAMGKAKNYSVNELQPLTHLVNGEPISPMFLTSLAEPIQNMMMSMVDDLIKVKIQGKSYVQASSVGLTKVQKGVWDIGGIHWLESSDPTRQLKMPEKIESTVTPAEILVPFHFFAGKRKLSLEDVMTDGVVDPAKLPADLLEMLGIRIPTSKQNSMLPMKIVGFLPENMGDTIIVPPGITTQMGSDFDVDKLFVYRRPYTADKESKVLVPDTDLRSEYFDLMWKTLLSPDMYTTIMSPLDKTDLKDEAKVVGTAMDKGNFFTARRQRADYLSQKDAKRLVGFSALTNTFGAGIQDLNLFTGVPVFDNEDNFTGYDPDPVNTFGGLELYKLSGYGTSTYNGETRTKLDNVGIMLSEFLDHAKNRTIDKLNLTVNTYAAAAALMMLEDSQGRSLNLQYVSRLLTQPVIRDFNIRMQRGGDMLGTYVPNLKETVLEELEKELVRRGAVTTDNSYTADQLLTLKPTDVNAQLDLLKAFAKLDAIGTRMSEMSALLNQDVNGTGGNLFNVMDKLDKVSDILADNIIINGEQLMSTADGTTEKGFLFEMVNSMADTLFEDFMPHKQVYSKVIVPLQRITGKKSATQVPINIKKDLLRSVRSFIYTDAVSALGVENVTAERARLLYSTAQGPSLAERVANAKQSWGQNNQLLRRLQPEIGNGQAPNYVTFVAATVTRLDDQENVRAWMELLSSTDSERRLLGEDLVKYVYLTGGNQDASNFVRYVPFGYLMSTGWFEALKANYNRLTGDDSALLTGAFLEQWIRHNPEQALELKPDLWQSSNGGIDIQEMFTLPFYDAEQHNSTYRKFLVRIDMEEEYTPYISIRNDDGSTLLYKKIGSGKEGVLYTRMDTLGTSLTDEFDLTSENPRSIIQENRALNDVWKTGIIASPAGKNSYEILGETLTGIAPIVVTETIPELIRNTLQVNKTTTTLEELQTRVIPEILAKGSIPDYYKNLYYFFSKYKEKAAGPRPEFTLRIGSSANPTFDAQLGSKYKKLGAGAYLRASNEVVLGNTPARVSAKKMHELMLHELTHWAVSPVVEHVMKGGQTSSDIQDAVNRLNTLYEYVKEARPDLLSLYQMSSIHEFIVGGTTNKEFMRQLNQIKYTEQSILSSLWNFLSELLDSLKSFLGVEVDKEGALWEFYNNMNVLMFSKNKTGLEGDAEIFFSEAAKPGKESPTTKLISKLEAQHLKVRKSMTSITDPKIRAEKRIQIQKITEDIEVLKSKVNMEDIAKIGSRQLDWVVSTIKDESPSVTEIMTAYHVTDVWNNILNIMFGDNASDSIPDLGDELSAVAARGKKMQDILVNGKMRQAIQQLTENRLSESDFTTGLKDMTVFSAYALSLNRAGSQLVQEIDLFLKNAGRWEEAENNKLTDDLTAFDAKVIALSKKMGFENVTKGRAAIFNMLVQENATGDAFGLVQEFSQNWFDERARLRGIRTSTIKKMSEALRDKPKERTENIKRVWRTYWNNIRKVGVFADITELLNEDGTVKADISTERARILNQLGDEVLTDKMIRHAQHRYQEYLQQLEEFEERIDAKVAEGILTYEQANIDKTNFKERNSPIRFFNQMKTSVDSDGLNEGDKFAVLYPKRENTHFYDDKYAAVQQNPALKEIYDDYVKFMQKFKSYLPLYVQWEMHENFLPVVQAHMLSDMTMKEYIGSMNQRVRDSLTATTYEESRKDKEDIPIRFIHKDREETSSYSRDLTRIAEMFGQMAVHYRHFSQVKDAVDMGEIILKEANQKRVAGVSEGEILTNTLAALKYAKSYMMYKNARQLEGKTTTVLYSMNPLVQRRIASKVKDLMIERNKLEKELLDPPAGKTVNDINKEMEQVDIELSKIEGQNVYLSKVGDRLIGINQLKALAFNPVSGFANLAFGMASMAIYANGHKDFNMKQAMTAMQMMTSSTRKYFTFGKSASPTAQKVLKLMQKTGILGDIVDSQYGESNLPGHQNKLKKSLDPYTFLRSSDYYMKGSVLVATMLGTNVTVDGKEMPVWEAYDDEGNLKYPELEGWDATKIGDAPQWEKFRNRALRISQIVMGNMDRNSPKLMNKKIIGRLIGQFRASWLPEGWAARWEDEKNDVQLGRVIKGRYKTYGDIGLSGSTTILLRQFLGMLGGSKNYFEDVYRNTDGKMVSDSEVDMENMRRNFTGMMWTLSLMAATMMLKGLIPDDDEEEGGVREALMLVLNLSNRVNQDLQFYSSPDVANSLIRNTIPAFDVVNDYIKAVKATQKAIGSEDYDWDDAVLKWTKATPYLNQINRTMYLTTHDLSTSSR